MGASRDDARRPPPPALGGAGRRRLLSYARKLTDDRVAPWCDPADFVGEALVEAYSKLEQYRGETEADFFAWVSGFVRNKIWEARRAYARVPRPEEGAATPIVLDASVGGELETEELRQHVRRVTMQTLSKADRKVVELVFSQGLNYTQAARRLNVSPSTCSRRLARILTTLEPRLRPYR